MKRENVNFLIKTLEQATTYTLKTKSFFRIKLKVNLHNIIKVRVK